MERKLEPETNVNDFFKECRDGAIKDRAWGLANEIAGQDYSRDELIDYLTGFDISHEIASEVAFEIHGTLS